MFELTATTRRPAAVGTVTKVVPHAGQYLHDRATAEQAVTALNTRHLTTDDGRPVTYAMRRVYLPACDLHDEVDGGCGNCEDQVDAWLDELAATTEQDAPPAVAVAAWKSEQRAAAPTRRHGSLAGR